MSTETALSTSTPAATPQIEIGEGDTMSPAERAYFESRGTKGFEAPTPAPARQNEPQQQAADGDDEDFDLEGEEAADAPARDPKTGKFVPKSAYLRVKETAKQTKAEAQQYREHLIAAKERLAILTEAANPQQKADSKDIDLADAPDIDPEVDIFGALKQAHARLAKVQQQVKQQESVTAEERTQRAFMQDIERFKATEPAFTEAFSFLVQQRHAELEALGWDKGERDRMLQDEAREVVQAALKSGKSAAETIFRIATARGFTKKAAAAPNALQEAAQQIERLENGRKASASLRGAGEGGASDGFNLNAYLSAGEAESMAMRDAYIRKHGRHAWDKVLRGG